MGLTPDFIEGKIRHGGCSESMRPLQAQVLKKLKQPSNSSWIGGAHV